MKTYVAAAALVLGGGLLAGSPASADPEPIIPGQCSKAQIAELRELGDNFVDACFLPGQSLGDVEGQPGSRMADDEEYVNENMDVIAESPLAGPFDDTSVGSDLAFQGDYAYAGNYDGLTVHDISDPTNPEQVAYLDCLGAQNDVSIYRDVLILSVDSVRSDDSCASTSGDVTSEDNWEGIRVVDISDPLNPEVVANVKTECGSHTNTLAPSKNGKALFVYVSSYGPTDQAVNCQPPHDAISIVRVGMANPAGAKLHSTPVLFPNGGLAGGDNNQVPTSGCHDITAYPAKDIAAGACMGDGILMDISKRTKPVVTERVRDTDNFTFWHSATFNNDGTKVVFTDELGGGGAPTCNNSVGTKRGANGIYKISRKGDLKFKSYYKISRQQSNTENCVSHNGSLIPVEGRDIMVQAWYQGGISVFDFTNGAKPKEVAFFDRGPISESSFVSGGYWSAYYYNGYIYGNDITRGFEVFDLDTPFADEAAQVEMSEFNPQSQPSFNG